MVRVVNQAIERMNIEPLLLKIFSSRRSAKAPGENIHFMWLSGGNKPGFRTINRFRSTILKDVMDQVFSSVLEPNSRKIILYKKCIKPGGHVIHVMTQVFRMSF